MGVEDVSGDRGAFDGQKLAVFETIDKVRESTLL